MAVDLSKLSGERTRKLMVDILSISGGHHKAHDNLMAKVHRAHTCLLCWMVLRKDLEASELQEVANTSNIDSAGLSNFGLAFMAHGIENVRKLMVTHSFELWETIKGELCQSSNTASSSQEQEGVGNEKRELCQQNPDNRKRIVRGARGNLEAKVMLRNDKSLSNTSPAKFCKLWIGPYRKKYGHLTVDKVKTLANKVVDLMKHVNTV